LSYLPNQEKKFANPFIERQNIVRVNPGKIYPPAKKRMRSRIGLIAVSLLFVSGICAIGGVGALYLYNNLRQEISTLGFQEEIPEETPAPTREPIPITGTYTVSGPPTLTVSFINQVLEYYQSPAQGKGQALYDYGVQHTIDPAYALAFFMQESSFGAQGVAAETHSLGNIRAADGQPDFNGYRKYDTWEDGFKDWYDLIGDLYIQQWELTTVDQIVPVYAPQSDDNNEKQYIHTIKLAVSTWQHGYVDV
jgi:hypothetical protein